VADRTFIQAIGVFLGLLAWDADPAAFAAAPHPVWAASADAPSAAAAQPADDGTDVRFVVACVPNAPAFYALSVIRPRAGLSQAEALAARDSLTGLVLTPGRPEAMPMLAVDGHGELADETLALRVAVPRDQLRRLAASGEGAEVHLTAGVAALGPFGGRDQFFPVRGLQRALAAVDQRCA
jgi:hypothetical protein